MCECAYTLAYMSEGVVFSYELSSILGCVSEYVNLSAYAFMLVCECM